VTSPSSQSRRNEVVTAPKPMKAEASQELFDLFNDDDLALVPCWSLLLMAFSSG
jgi:hypothetical protein